MYMKSKHTETSASLAKKLLVAGDTQRLKIMCCIFSDKKVCVSDIAKHIHASVATTSHHLQVLTKEGLLNPVREGKHVCYELTKTPFAKDLKKLICKYK